MDVRNHRPISPPYTPLGVVGVYHLASDVPWGKEAATLGIYLTSLTEMDIH